MANEWYFMRGQERVGPLTQDQIQQLYQQGDITDTHYVWTAGIPNWVPAGQVRDHLVGPVASDPDSPNLLHDLGLDEPVVKPYTYTPGGGGYGGGGAVGMYAGFWLRVVAVIVDGVIFTCVLGIPLAIVQMIMMGGMDTLGAPQPAGQQALWNIAGTVLNIVIYAAFEASPWQGTPGKKILRIRVTDLDGDRVSFARAATRNVAKILSMLILLIGFIMAGFTEKKQALHDMLAGCLVVRD
jgi:uncharacterized RDD family membrane protein YckC